MRAILVAYLSLILFAGIAGAWAQDEPAQDDAAPAIDVENDPQSDAAIERRLALIFDELSGFDDIEVEVSAGIVRLTGTVIENDVAEQAERLASRVVGVVTVLNEITPEASVERRLSPAFERLKSRIAEAVTLLPLFGVALLVFVMIAFIGVWIARLHTPWDRIAPNAFIADLLRQVVRLTFIAGGLVVALDIMGAIALLGAILGAAGIFGLAIGFAVRDTIENYIASIMLSIRQPFRPNDHIQVGGFEGHVIRLTTRATVILSLDGNHVRIPNADIFKGVIVNFTRNPERRFEFVLGVEPDCDLKRAMQIGLEAIQVLNFVLSEPKPLGIIQDVGDSNVELWFAGWIDQRVTDYAKARGEAIRICKGALEEANITLPEPTYRLNLDSRRDPVIEADLPPSDGAPVERRVLETAALGDAAKETTVLRKVEAERREMGEPDLLDPEAPRE